MSPPTVAEWDRLAREVDELDVVVRALREDSIRADARRDAVAAQLDDLQARSRACETKIAEIGSKLDVLIARLESAPPRHAWRLSDTAPVLVALASLVGAVATAIGAYTGHLPGQSDAAASSTPPAVVAPMEGP